MPREKSRYRERNRDKRSSSYDSDSSYEKKKSKSKHKRRSRSRDRSLSSSYKRKRSSSRTKYRRRSYSRSDSRDRYEGKSRRRSTSRSRSKRSDRRSLSRTKSRSVSSSRSKTKQSRKKVSKRSRSSSRNRSPSQEIKRPTVSKKFNIDDTESKVEKAIKAAAAAGLTMTKIPTYEVKDVEIKEDMPTIHDRNLLNELNSDSFVQKSFTSSRSKKQQNIVIDLNSDTVTMPDVSLNVKQPDSIIDLDALPSEEELKEAWIKKLYLYRKKMLKGEN